MAHTEDYGQVKYIPMILQYSKILKYIYIFKAAVYGTLIAAILRSMFGLCFNEAYVTMVKYNGRDDDRNNDRN